MSGEEGEEKHDGSGSIRPIKDAEYLERLFDEGYVIKGPRSELSKDLTVFKRLLRRGYEFVPEDWLVGRGYKLVDPSPFTKGFKLAYKLAEGVLEQYYRSNYSLIKDDREIPLYLKSKE